MRKKYLKEQIDSLQNIVLLRNKEINQLDSYIDDLYEEMNNLSREHKTLKKRYSNETREANKTIQLLTNELNRVNKELEEIKTQNISLKRENLTWFQKNEILEGHLETSKKMITELNKRLVASKKSVKKYCENKSEGI